MFIRPLEDYTLLEADQGTEAAGTNDDNALDADAGGNEGGNAGGSQPFIQFPDEKSFMNRVRREGRSQLEAKAKELGFDSVAEMDAALQAAKDREANEQTETDKLRKENEKLKGQLNDMLTKANARLVRAEVKSIAADLEIVDADAAYALMNRDDIAVDDEGNVTGVEDALKALLKAKPYLKGQSAASRSGGDFRNGNGDAKGKNPWSKEHLNLTEQGRIMRENPALAQQLKAEAKG